MAEKKYKYSKAFFNDLKSFSPIIKTKEKWTMSEIESKIKSHFNPKHYTNDDKDKLNTLLLSFKDTPQGLWCTTVLIIQSWVSNRLNS